MVIFHRFLYVCQRVPLKSAIFGDFPPSFQLGPFKIKLGEALWIMGTPIAGWFIVKNPMEKYEHMYICIYIYIYEYISIIYIYMYDYIYMINIYIYTYD